MQPGQKGFFLMFISLFFLSAILNAKDNPPKTVDSVDLEKYTGKWYEISKIPNSFQDQCVRNTTAEYTTLENGKLKVVNSCEKADGKIDRAEGIAKVVDRDSNAKLKVSFVSILGFHLFWGDYWIIGLADDYSWAIVGHPERKYGWILSRAPSLDESEIEKINQILRENGYNPENFVKTVQEEPSE